MSDLSRIGQQQDLNLGLSVFKSVPFLLHTISVKINVLNFIGHLLYITLLGALMILSHLILPTTL